MSFELRQLRQVLALDEYGSFARAAAALGLSQPALSRSIQALERHVGRELFLRTASGVAPTDIGRLLIQRARQIVQLTEELDSELVHGRTVQSGHVNVGGGPFPAGTILGTALARFITDYPQVTVRLRVGNWDELLRQLRARELDFFVAETSTMEREHGLEIDQMSERSIYFIARHGHPLMKRASTTTADIFSYPFVAPSRIPPRLLAPMFAAQRTRRDTPAATRAFPSLECGVLATTKRIVLSSDAITAVTLASVEAELEAGQMTVLGSEPWLSVRYGLVSLKGHPMSNAAAELRDFVVEAEQIAARDEAELAVRWGHTATGREQRGTQVRSKT